MILAHIIAGPLDAVVELVLPVALFAALWWWSARKSGGGPKEGKPKR